MSVSIEYEAGLDLHPEANDYLALLDACYVNSRSLAMPSQWSFAVSAVCDLDCPYCPRQTYSEITKSGLMDFDRFKSCAKYLKFSRYTGLFGLGEPFLHPDFLEFVKTVKEAGGYAATSSHGMRLSDSVIDRLIEYGLDELEVSIDAVTPKIFNFLRAGADIETVTSNLTRLQQEKARRGSSIPRLHIAAVISIYNLKEIPALVRFSKKIGADKIVFTNMIITRPEDKDISVYPSTAFAERIAYAQRLGKKIGMDVAFFYQKPYPWQREIYGGEIHDHKERVLGYGCPLPWRSMNVELKGDVKPCCYYDDTFGNCFSEPAQAIVNNNLFQNLRERLMSGDLPRCCVDCGNLVRVTPEYLQQKLGHAHDKLQSLNDLVDPDTLRELTDVFDKVKETVEKRIRL